MTSQTFPPDDGVDDDLLDRFLAGVCTSDEISQVQHWLEQQPVGSVVLDEMRTRPQAERLRLFDAKADWGNLSQRLRDEDPSYAAEHTTVANSAPSQLVPARFGANILTAIATTVTAAAARPRYAIVTAALALAIAIGWNLSTPRTTPSLGSVSSYATANGERATVTLPDGSTVVLNVATRLQVPADYAFGNRTVHLNGEALFTVNHASGQPFTVVAGPSTTRVLGTRFVVRHYADDTAATVAVRDGKVSVQSVVLTANQQISVGSYTIGAVQRADPGQFEFVSGTMELAGISLRDAVPSLNRWYGADIRIRDTALSMRRLKGGFPAGTIADLAEVLELALNCQVVREGHVLTLYSRD